MLIPLDQPGVRVVPIRTMLGDSGFNEVYFDDARTSSDNVLGPTGEGWKAAMTTLGHERATSVLNYQFSFRREMATVTEIARRRGATADPILRDRLIDSIIGLEIMGCNNLRTLGTALRDGEFGPEASIGEVLLVHLAQEVHRARDGHPRHRRVAGHRVGRRTRRRRRDPATGLRSCPGRVHLRRDQRDPAQHHQRTGAGPAARAARRGRADECRAGPCTGSGSWT